MLRSKRKATLIPILIVPVAELLGQPVRPASYTVTNLNDSGVGPLRQAIIDANASATNNVIDFSVSGTITLTSGELAIANNMRRR